MGIGQRLQRLIGGGGGPVETDPSAMKEAGVVMLAEGPMTVERLRVQGIDALGIESVDPVTGVRTYMRIMVRQSDLVEARNALAESVDPAAAGEALEELTGPDADDDIAAAEEASQQAMSELFVAADRLSGRPGDAVLLAEIEVLAAEVTDSSPPFGVEALAWSRVASLAAAVVSAGEGTDEDEVRAATQALRTFLREYV